PFTARGAPHNQLGRGREGAGRLTDTVEDSKTAANTALLEVRGLSKSYGAYMALTSFDLAVQVGHAVSVIGENGAGKSTLAKILAGAIRPDTGTIKLKGEEVRFSSPRDALRHGVAFIPQELAYLPNLTVAENIMVGTWPSRFGVTTQRMVLRSAQEESLRFGVEIDVRRSMSSLKLGERQLVEIVKAL